MNTDTPETDAVTRFPLDDAEIQETSNTGFCLLQWDFITHRMRIPQRSIQMPIEAAKQIIDWRDKHYQALAAVKGGQQ